MLLRILFEKAIIEVMVIDHTKSFESIPRDKGARHATDEQGNGIAIQYLIDQPFDSWVYLGFFSPLLPSFIHSEYLATATNRMLLEIIFSTACKQNASIRIVNTLLC